MMSHIVRVSEVENYIRKSASAAFQGFFVDAILPASHPRAMPGYITFGTVDADSNGNYLEYASRSTLQGTYYLGYLGEYPGCGHLVMFNAHGDYWVSKVKFLGDTIHSFENGVLVILGPHGTGPGQFDLYGSLNWPIKIIVEY
jgi:hypothetical protein